MAVTLSAEGDRLRPIGERVWSHVEGNYHEDMLRLGKDGRALVLIDRTKPVPDIRVIVNWPQEIARKFMRN